MPLTFEQFRNQNTGFAAALLDHRADAHLVDELCRAAFEELPPTDRANARTVHSKLLRIFYERFVDDLANPTACAMRILDPHLDVDPARTWISFTRFLEMLKPALLEQSLLRRLVAALHILEWGEGHARNIPIKRLLEKAFSALHLKEPACLPLSEAAATLTILRDALCNELAGTCTHEAFLRALICHTDDIALEHKAIGDLRELMSRPPKLRFASVQRPNDRYAWLRQHWEEAKEHIRQRLDLSTLLVSRPNKDDFDYGK